MTTFIAKIQTREDGLLEFYFASVDIPPVKKYFITTIDRSARSHVFYMQLSDGMWRIDTTRHHIQPWIVALEFELAQVIAEKG